MKTYIAVLITALLAILFLVCQAQAGGLLLMGSSGGATACTWDVAWDGTVETGDSTWADYNGTEDNYRVVLAAGDIAYTGDTIRVVLQANSWQTTDWDGVSICVRSGSTDDCTTAPTRITFSTGSSTASAAAGATVTSDEIAFSLTAADHLWHTFLTGANNYEAYLDNVSTYTGYSGGGGTDGTVTQTVSYGANNSYLDAGMFQVEVCH